MTSRFVQLLPLLVIAVTTMVSAHAEETKETNDTWKDPYPGVRYLKRESPNRLYHVISVQLIRPDLSVRTTKPDERGQTAVAFAKLVNAAVAINGDAFTTPGFIPRGPAVGVGEAWPREAPVPANLAFIACGEDGTCKIDRTKKGEAFGEKGKAASPKWTSVVGGGSWLIRKGAVRSVAEDERCGAPCTEDRPRSAVGLDKAGETLFLLVAEGGRANFRGPTPREVALVLAGLGAHDAMSLDGGESSSLVLEGKQVNMLPTGKRKPGPVANHLAVLYKPPADGCTVAQRVACGKYGCACVAGTCNGGTCPGDGCTPEQRSSCARYGCGCVDMRCNGGFCDGTGCTLRQTMECQKKSCGCVDGKCSGGNCPGSSCTAKRTSDCSKYGCACVDMRCNGGFCAGNGCEPGQKSECSKYGCGCVDGKCAGGYCDGTGCTAKQVTECAKSRCSCVNGACSGGECPGNGCTAKMIADCTKRGCGCEKGRCQGGRCASNGCGCRLATAHGGEGLPLIAVLLLAAGLVGLAVRVRSR